MRHNNRVCSGFFEQIACNFRPVFDRRRNTAIPHVIGENHILADRKASAQIRRRHKMLSNENPVGRCVLMYDVVIGQITGPRSRARLYWRSFVRTFPRIGALSCGRRGSLGNRAYLRPYENSAEIGNTATPPLQ